MNAPLDLLRVKAVIRRQFFVQLRAPQRWFDVLIWPMVDVVIWGSIGLFVDQQGGAGRAGAPYMLSGILLMHVMYQANVSMSCGFLDETWSRNLVNLMVSPLREVELLAGLILVSAARLVAGLGAVALAARVLLDGEPMPWDLVAKGAAGVLVAVPVATAVLWRTLHLFRARGYITRYS